MTLHPPPSPAEQLRSLRQGLAHYFSLDEMMTLAFYLEVEWEELGERGKSAVGNRGYEVLKERGRKPRLPR